jgi:hypothetical protein
VRRRAGRAAPYLLLLGAALYLYYLAGRFEFAAPAGLLGPDAWPKLILGLLGAVCLYQIARGLFGRSEGGAQALLQSLMAGAADDAGGVHAARRSPGLLAGGIAVTVAYVLLLDVIGFVLATALYLAAFMLVGGYRRYGVIALASLGGSLALVVIFMRVAYISLPPGAGPFRAFSFGLLALLGVK